MAHPRLAGPDDPAGRVPDRGVQERRTLAQLSWGLWLTPRQSNLSTASYGLLRQHGPHWCEPFMCADSLGGTARLHLQYEQGETVMIKPEAFIRGQLGARPRRRHLVLTDEPPASRPAPGTMTSPRRGWSIRP